MLRWNTTGITVAGLVGNPGNANNQLNRPFDVILDYSNNLYIADYANHRIQKYLFNSLVGQTVAGNTTAGSSEYQLYHPSRVILDSNKNLYVLDTYNYRVQLWLNGAISGTTIAGTTGKTIIKVYVFFITLFCSKDTDCMHLYLLVVVSDFFHRFSRECQ